MNQDSVVVINKFAELLEGGKLDASSIEGLADCTAENTKFKYCTFEEHSILNAIRYVKINELFKEIRTDKELKLQAVDDAKIKEICALKGFRETIVECTYGRFKSEIYHVISPLFGYNYAEHDDAKVAELMYYIKLATSPLLAVLEPALMDIINSIGEDKRALKLYSLKCNERYDDMVSMCAPSRLTRAMLRLEHISKLAHNISIADKESNSTYYRMFEACRVKAHRAFNNTHDELTCASLDKVMFATQRVAGDALFARMSIVREYVDMLFRIIDEVEDHEDLLVADSFRRLNEVYEICKKYQDDVQQIRCHRLTESEGTTTEEYLEVVSKNEPTLVALAKSCGMLLGQSDQDAELKTIEEGEGEGEGEEEGEEEGEGESQDDESQGTDEQDAESQDAESQGTDEQDDGGYSEQGFGMVDGDAVDGGGDAVDEGDSDHGLVDC